MQARLGFKRQNRTAQVRLRPLDHQAAQPTQDESGGSLGTGQFAPTPPNQPKTTLQSPSPVYRRRRRPDKDQSNLSLSPKPPSNPPPTDIASRPVTALLPEQGNTTWTTFEGMTRDTVGAVLREAMREEELPADELQQVPQMEAAVAAVATITLGDQAAGVEEDLAAAGAVASFSSAEVAATSSAAEIHEATTPLPPPPSARTNATPPKKKLSPETAPGAASEELAIVVEIEDMAQELLTRAYDVASRHPEVLVAPPGPMMCSPPVAQSVSGGGWCQMPSVGTWACFAPTCVRSDGE